MHGGMLATGTTKEYYCSPAPIIILLISEINAVGMHNNYA